MVTIETFVHILDRAAPSFSRSAGRLPRSIAARHLRHPRPVLCGRKFWRDWPRFLIGAVPPAALTNGRYLLVSVLAGLITFFSYAGVDRLRSPVLLFDAAGLSFFAVAGAQKAIEFGLNPVMSALLGMLTGIGGGMTRDVLLGRSRRCCVPISTPLRRWPARPSSSSAICLVFPMASQLWPEGLCASAFASWRSDTAGICLSRTCPRKDAREQSAFGR